VNVLPNWPAQSPDLNIVEHCWAYMAKKMVGRCFPSEDALEAACKEVWEARPPEFIPALYASLPHRLAAVRKVSGGPTKY
jgi:hypothetical protein